MVTGTAQQTQPRFAMGEALPRIWGLAVLTVITTSLALIAALYPR